MPENLVSDWLNYLSLQLSPLSDSYVLDAQGLLAHVLGKPRAWVLAHPEATLSPEQEKALAKALIRLEGGEALPYVLGRWEFYGLDFVVTPAVLIPRPETELLVEQALDWLRYHPAHWALDVGTGSGCIAVALAANTRDLLVLACDISFAALEVARQNACRVGVEGRVCCIQADLAPPVSMPFDLICANLPYIPSEKLPSLQVAQREPWLALDGGLQGLHQIRNFLKVASGRLSKGGLLLLEIESSQGRAVCNLVQQAFPQAEVKLIADLAGHDRLVRVEKA